jgi:hypothetical protein
MKGRGSFSLALAILLLGPSVTEAQRGGRLAVGAPSGRRLSSVRRSSSARRGGFSKGVFTGGTGLTNPYPGTGLGINGINSIATQGNLGVEAAIDPATQWNLALAERLLRSSGGIFPGGGYYLLSGGGAYAVPAESVENDPSAQQQPQSQVPQVIVLQEASPQSLSQSAQESVAPSLPDVGEFTLLLKTGKQIEAVAFTRMNDRIIYITSDGGRRTIALSDVDTDATVRLNQERGTPLQLPL